MPLGWIPMLWGCDHWLRAVVAFIPPLLGSISFVCSHTLYRFGRLYSGSCIASVELDMMLWCSCPTYS